MAVKDFFTPARCRLCFDKMNVFSDLTIGDPHGIPGIDRNGGESLIIPRSPAGMALFQEAVRRRSIDTREASYDAVLSGQDILKKRREWSHYVIAWQDMGRPCPNYCEIIPAQRTLGPKRKYQRLLRHSLSLDRYPNRDILLRAIHRQLTLRKLVKFVLLPIYLARRVIHALR
jgi:coenzyme F420 hydrogenase subunit beta